MIKLERITATTAVCLLAIGSLFKFMHWPGAGVMFVLGSAILIIGYIPTHTILALKHTKEKGAKSLKIVGSIVVSALAAFCLFKVMHWPGTNILLVTSIGALSFLYIPLFAFRLKENNTRQDLSLHNLVMLICAAAFLFLMIKMPFSKNFQSEHPEVIQTIESYKANH